MTLFNRHSIGERLLIHLVLIAGGMLMLIPFFWLVSSSLKAPYEIYVFPPQWIPDPIHWENYSEVFAVVPVLGYVGSFIGWSWGTIRGFDRGESDVWFGILLDHFDYVLLVVEHGSLVGVWLFLHIYL